MESGYFKYESVKCYVSNIDFTKAYALAIIKKACANMMVSPLYDAYKSGWIVIRFDNEEGQDVYDSLIEVWDIFGEDAVGYSKQHPIFKEMEEKIKLVSSQKEIYEALAKNDLCIEQIDNKQCQLKCILIVAETLFEDQKASVIQKHNPER